MTLISSLGFAEGSTQFIKPITWYGSTQELSADNCDERESAGLPKKNPEIIIIATMVAYVAFYAISENCLGQPWK